MRLVRTTPIDRAARIIDSLCQRESARLAISVCLAQHQPATSEVDTSGAPLAPKGPSALTLQPTQAHGPDHDLSETYKAISAHFTDALCKRLLRIACATWRPKRRRLCGRSSRLELPKLGEKPVALVDPGQSCRVDRKCTI